MFAPRRSLLVLIVVFVPSAAWAQAAPAAPEPAKPAEAKPAEAKPAEATPAAAKPAAAKSAQAPKPHAAKAAPPKPPAAAVVAPPPKPPAKPDPLNPVPPPPPKASPPPPTAPPAAPTRGGARARPPKGHHGAHGKGGQGYHAKHGYGRPGGHGGPGGHGPRPHLFGRIQAWAIPFIGEDALVDNHDPANAAGFRLRRARIGAKGHITRRSVYSLEVELADQVTGRTGVIEAWMGWYTWQNIEIAMGVQKVPFSHGSDVSSAKMQLPDRALGVGLIADHREAGLSVSGDHDLVELQMGGGPTAFNVGYTLGVYNGSFGAFSRGDDNKGLLSAGRLTLGIGDIGQSEADLDGGPLRIRLGVGAMLNDSSVGDIKAMAGDLRLKIMGISLTVAHIQDVTKPSTRPDVQVLRAAEIRRRSHWAQLGYMVWPGRLEAAFRIEMLDDSDAADDAGDVRVYTGSLNYFLRGERMKVQAAFIRRQEMEGPAVDNDAAIISSQVSF